jgi:putative transposase
MTAFRFRLKPTAEQELVLWRHTGASRFAYNQCLAMVKKALDVRAGDKSVPVPWTGFDLINLFNTWKRSSEAGRRFSVDRTGVTTVEVTGLEWRHEVSQQVFEEAAVDLGRALAGFSNSRAGKRSTKVRFPRFHSKGRTTPSFRVRNKITRAGKACIRVGDSQLRSITLPNIGTIALSEDTRRLRRMVRNGRATLVFVAVAHRGGHWYASVTVRAADLHQQRRHPTRTDSDTGGWVGVDRGLAAYVVAANARGQELLRVTDPPRPLRKGLIRQRQLVQALSRKQRGSANRRKALAALVRHHSHVRNVRRHFQHEVANQLVKTHDRLVLENLHIAGMLKNHRLARSVADAGWAELARIVSYRQAWLGGEVIFADRWFASSKTCSACGNVREAIGLGERVFCCPSCACRMDRDANAATNLAVWGERHYAQTRDPAARGPVINAC